MVCFVCGLTGHEVDLCPTKKQVFPVAAYLGSAASGLGFFHIDLPEKPVRELSIKNIGVVYVESGAINKEELASGLTAIYKTTWPWQIRELDEWSFLVKFPPHIRVEEVASYPCFGLPKEGVTVNVMVWEGDIDYMADLEKIWVQFKGLQPQWCEWKVLFQFASALGFLVDVDWQGMFQTFYEVVRLKILCRDHTKIPESRNFNVCGKLYQISFVVEKPGPITVGDGDDDPPQDGNSPDEEEKKEGNTEDMDTENNGRHDTAANNTSNSVSKNRSSSGEKTKSVHLAEKLHEVAAAFMEKRDGFGQGSASRLSPVMDCSTGRDKVIDWLTAAGDEDGCVNLLKEMELAQDEDDFFYMEPDEPTEVQQETTANQQLQHQQNDQQKKKWGPIFNTRQSSRIVLKDKTIM
jgi:hypothetical protein